MGYVALRSLRNKKDQGYSSGCHGKECLYESREVYLSRIRNNEIRKIMGVMGCSKKYCENIMCDTYINSVGYVCGDCQNEFEKYANSGEVKTPKNEGEIEELLTEWVSMEKGIGAGEEMTVSEFFNKRDQ